MKSRALRRLCVLLLIIIAATAGAVLIRRGVRLSGVADPSLIGRWTSDFVPTEWGTARLILDIDRDSFVFTFDPVQGDPMSVTDTYSVIDGIFQSPSFDSGNPIRYRVDGYNLMFLDAVDGPSAFRRAWWSVIWP